MPSGLRKAFGFDKKHGKYAGTSRELATPASTDGGGAGDGEKEGGGE